jgi:phosphatidylserine/phosphatidylglycerophosphate/cardiolipin synthase-like enzyme
VVITDLHQLRDSNVVYSLFWRIFAKPFGNTVASGPTIQVVIEGKIKRAILSHLDQASAEDKVDIMMFYLSDRTVLNALKRAQARGVQLRVLLAPNKDAFGRGKTGYPVDRWRMN